MYSYTYRAPVSIQFSAAWRALVICIHEKQMESILFFFLFMLSRMVEFVLALRDFLQFVFRLFVCLLVVYLQIVKKNLQRSLII